ncbi:DUF2161 family putative PD-(D/E)XK-type phosphodiesterase [Acanthopleuribacter pedis]|uniref:DUF2161 domain-containing phosphodiesterase n=1 Tax=Acanthopleuribacter pedis TaxID=442870 RepID=A0A8J7QBM2_9BACT|nr:DUF2161 family putative PD-(D/E)XK-type phosphodiesterase [Acanthopleuribacter pedis]MBO1323152.1 hypothetical protein [Acanthopleuribacter pedis]
MKESDLYLPLKGFLENEGYRVKGEVQKCDVVAVRAPETPLVVELKLTLNLDVLLQAVERLAVADRVYIGVPKSYKALSKKRKRVVKLLRMLGLGLLVIDPAPPGRVEVLLDPGPYQPRPSKRKRQRLLNEFERREGDPNLGGTATRKGIMTSYRQRALAIARFLEASGPTRAALVAKQLQDPKVRDIMYRNVYGWFERRGKGVYGLSPRGKAELPAWQKPENRHDET